MRVNINMSEELLNKIDEKAKEMYVSRSAYISMALTEKMKNDNALNSMPELYKLAQEILKKQNELDSIKKVEG